MQYSRAILTALSLSMVTLPADADFIGLYVGGGGWNQSPSGTFQYQGDEVDVEDDLHLSGESEVYVWAALEHPVPVLPNVRISGVNQLNTGNGSVSTTFTFGGDTYTMSQDIDTRIRLDQRDVSLYYEVLDNVVDLDIGVNVKYVDGDAEVSSPSMGQQSRTTFEAYIPMLYGRIGGDLPFTGLSADVAAAAVSYNGHHLIDVKARVAYESPYRIGLEGGYRLQELKLDDVDGVSTDMTIDGPFVGLFVHL